MNIIYINSDSYRYDNLFDRASMPVKTPNLDAFSKRSVSMKNFYTGSFPTIPERTDMVTGRVGWTRYGWQAIELSSQNSFPKLLEKNGYATQLICDCPHLFNANFNRHFCGAVTIRGQEGDKPFLRMNYPIEDVMPREKTRTDHLWLDQNLANLHSWTNRNWRYERDTFPPRTAGMAVEWLEDNYKFNPFYLWVDFFDPHEPWDPPEYMVKKYDPDYDGIPMIHPNYGKSSDLTEAELKNLRAHYCAEAELVDRHVGRILEKIDDLSLWENTIVIFTTDHGISLGEKERTGKSNIHDNDDRYWPLYPEIAHIPFMIAGPGLEGGTEVDVIAQPVDTMPTLAELAGIEVAQPEDIEGRSFAPQLKGDWDKTCRKFAVTSQWLGQSLSDNGMTPVVYTDKWAYIPIGPYKGRELYDIESDPETLNNVIDGNEEKASELHELLIDFLRVHGAPEETVKIFQE